MGGSIDSVARIRGLKFSNHVNLGFRSQKPRSTPGFMLAPAPQASVFSVVADFLRPDIISISQCLPVVFR